MESYSFYKKRKYSSMTDIKNRSHKSGLDNIKSHEFKPKDNVTKVQKPDPSKLTSISAEKNKPNASPKVLKNKLISHYNEHLKVK